MKELLEAYKELLECAIDYIEYEHSGDPWEEDRRAMGEMMLDDLKRSGRIEDYKKLLKEGNQHLEDQKEGEE